MVGIVVVSHSKALAEETIRLATEMKHSEFPLINGSGTDGDYFGSNPLIIKEAVEKAYTKEGVLVFVDLGSSVLNTQIAIDFLDASVFNLENIKIADAPLVEGLIAAVAMNDERASMEDILLELEEFRKFSKINV